MHKFPAYDLAVTYSLFPFSQKNITMLSFFGLVWLGLVYLKSWPDRENTPLALNLPFLKTKLTEGCANIIETYLHAALKAIVI